MMNKNLDFLFEGIEFTDHIAVFGEWVGQGIQNGVAVSNLPKSFVVFAYMVDGVWTDIQRSDSSQNIYHITEFPTWTIQIDFNTPESVQNELVTITEQVEKECPVGKHFYKKEFNNKEVGFSNYKDLPDEICINIKNILENLQMLGENNPIIILNLD